MKKFLKKVWEYLKDWKNLLGHTLVGVAIILVSAVLPLPWWARLLILAAIIVFNIFRERIFSTIFHKKRSVLENEEIND